MGIEQDRRFAAEKYRLMKQKKKKSGFGGAAFVLALLAIVIVILYVFFIAKDPALHSGDTEEELNMSTSIPVETALPTAEPMDETSAEFVPATPMPGLSRQIAALSVADEADVIFLASATGEGARCSFYAFQKDGGRWSVALETNGFIGREGVNYGEREEGDYTTPGGIYPMGECFGILPMPAAMSLPYTKIDADCYWDGDQVSDSYNRMVRKSQMPADWDEKASEHLTDYVEAYRYCMNIGFNTHPAIPGRGFAIFLHCTRTGMEQTAGCVAIPCSDMVKCLQLATEKTYIVILRDIGDLTEIEK